jgi:hypothetical protein
MDECLNTVLAGAFIHPRFNFIGPSGMMRAHFVLPFQHGTAGVIEQ